MGLFTKLTAEQLKERQKRFMHICMIARQDPAYLERQVEREKRIQAIYKESERDYQRVRNKYLREQLYQQEEG